MTPEERRRHIAGAFAIRSKTWAFNHHHNWETGIYYHSAGCPVCGTFFQCSGPGEELRKNNYSVLKILRRAVDTHITETRHRPTLGPIPDWAKV